MRYTGRIELAKLGLQDRDYMRRRYRRVAKPSPIKNRTWFLTASAVIGLLSAGVWLVRDMNSVMDEFGPSAGALIVNINTATEVELRSIPGIGATRAAQIVVGRPYETVDDLIRVSGIGERSLESIRPFVTVDGDTRKRR